MSFTNDVDRLIDKSLEKARRTFVGTSISLAARIIKRTPVKDGYARGSWQPTIGSLPSSARDNNPDKSGAKTARESSETAKQMQLDDVFYLTSALSYIKRLEDGSSEQARRGMVALTVAEFEAVVKSEVNRNK